MRQGHSSMVRRIPPPAVNSCRRQDGRRISLLSIQEQVRLPSNHGIVAARSLSVLRLEQSPSLHDQETRFFVRPTGAVVEPSLPAAVPTLEPPRQQPNPRETECLLRGKRVVLRKVGEVARDEAGDLFEVGGQQVRRLGELVRDERGRIFEVCEPPQTEDAVKPITPRQHDSRDAKGSKRADRQSGRQAQESASSVHEEKAGHSETQLEPDAGYRKILAEPGICVTI